MEIAQQEGLSRHQTPSGFSSFQGLDYQMGGESGLLTGVSMESFAELFVSAQNLSQSCIAIQLAGGEDGKVQTGIPDLSYSGW